MFNFAEIIYATKVMETIDYIVIILFSIGIVAAGLSFSGKGSDMKNFFAAGGSVPWWMAGLSLFMGFFSAGTFVVWGSIAYSHGLVSISIQMGMCIAGFLVAFLLAPRWKHTGVLTAAEYINERLGGSTRVTYTYLFLIVSLFTTGAFLYPVAKIVEVSTGLSLNVAILLLGGISIVYVAMGGLWAVVVTDVLQFVILSAAVLIVVPLSFNKVGGVVSFIEQAPDNFFSPVNGEYTWAFLIAFCLYNFIFLGGNWSYVQRYTSVATKSDARKVGLLFGFLYLICPVLWMLPPMIYRVCNGSLEGLADEGAYLLMCKEVLPKGILGLMLGGMIFATVSSLNGALNISSGVFTNDIYKRLNPHASEKRLMLVARLSTIGFGVLAIAVALLIPQMGGIVNVVISVAALTGVPLYLPVLWTLFSRRQNRHTILATTLISLTINAVFKFVTPLFGLSLSRTLEMVVGVSVPVVILVLFEIYLAIRKQDDRHATYSEQMIAARARAIPKSETEKSVANKYSFKVVGIGIALTGLLIAILGILAFGKTTWFVTCIGIILLAIGTTIVLFTQK